MSSTVEASGSCVCGVVSIHTANAATNVGACHCSTCRKWGGGPLMAINCGGDVEISGSEHVAVYASSAWAERGFCSQCGTHLYCLLKQAGQYLVPAGVFDSIEGLNFNHQIFIDKKPRYYNFANETQNMTGAEVFAAFSENS